jgi:hypothetical protein
VFYSTILVSQYVTSIDKRITEYWKFLLRYTRKNKIPTPEEGRM